MRFASSTAPLPGRAAAAPHTVTPPRTLRRRLATLIVGCMALCFLLAGSAFAGSGSLVERAGDGELQIFVHFDSPPSLLRYENVKRAWTLAGEILCDATDGQVRLDRVTFTGGQRGRERADFRYTPWPCQSFSSLRGLGAAGVAATICSDDHTKPHILAHEAGHLVFGLGDQYPQIARTTWYDGVPHTCDIGPGFEADMISETHHSIMQLSGSMRCVDALGVPGPTCTGGLDCAAGLTCRPILVSELSTAWNHDLVRGGNGPCPPTEATTEVELSIADDEKIPLFGAVSLFDSSTFHTARQSSLAHADVRLYDSLGTRTSPRLHLYLLRLMAQGDRFRLVAAIDEKELVGGSWGVLHVLDTWTLDLRAGVAVLDGPRLGGDPLVTIGPLTSGADDLEVTLDLSSLEVLWDHGPAPALEAASLDGSVTCSAPDCAERWDWTTRTWATSRASLASHARGDGFESDWETVVRNFPFLDMPVGLPKADNPECAGGPPPEFVDDFDAADQVLMVLDHSASMGRAAGGAVGVEICANGLDDDGDGAVDESAWGDECTVDRLAFVRAAGRVLLAFEQGSGVETGLVAFHHAAALKVPLAPLDAAHRMVVDAELDALAPSGRTAIGDALQTALDEFLAPAHADAGSQVALLLSDGESNAGVDPETVVPQLQQAGVQLFTIPAGAGADTAAFGELAASTGGASFGVDHFGHVPAVFAEIIHRLAGHSPVVKRTPFTVAKDPSAWPASAPELAGEPLPVERAKFDIPVEKGSTELLVFLGGRNPTIETWLPQFELHGPAGELIEDGDPQDESDPFFHVVRVPFPKAGLWRFETWTTDPDLQKSIFLAVSTHPEIDFAGDASPRQVSAEESVRITATPTFVTPMEPQNVEVIGHVLRTDGSQVPIAMEPGEGGVWHADFDAFTGRGRYEVRLEVVVTEGAQTLEGEPFSTAPTRADADVVEYTRSTTASFDVVDGAFTKCTSDDCDGDGLLNWKECGSDTDGDGIPNEREVDSDRDDVFDDVEGLGDVDGDGTADACQATQPPVPKV